MTMTHRSSVSGITDPDTSGKSDTSTEREKIRERKERVRPPTKVVIRRLPPTMTEDEFLSFISPVPEHDFFYFVRADKSLGPHAFSRAYINFIKQEDIFTFKEQFDNYTFMDKKGNEYPAVVEFAPFERLPKKRAVRKKDPKMKTLQQDPTYIAFLESLEKKKADTVSVQHCPMEYFPPPEREKITTTPLLDFLRQRRAEKQRVRDERREDRRRKDLDRKRVKDIERDRRRMPNKPDTNSILKVLRNPDHIKEMKEDNVKEKQHQQIIGIRKREEDRQRHNREKEIRRETRTHTSVKSYRDDRQKQMEIRAQRKISDEQHKKLSFERSQMHSKTSDNRSSHDGDKSQSFRTSETGRSQEFDKTSGKLSETHRGQEFERSHFSSKPIDSRRGQDYDRYGRESKYHSGDQRKMGNERCKDYEHRKTYKESENRRSSFNKDMEQKRNYASDQRRCVRNYSDVENRRNMEEKKNVEKVNNEEQKEIINTGKKVCEEPKKWENMGAKPKKKPVTEDTAAKKVEYVEKYWADDVDDEIKALMAQTNETSAQNEVESNRQETAIKEVEKAQKKGETEVKNSSDESHLSRTERSKSEEQNLTETTKDIEHKHGEVLNRRRGSLDSGHHEAEMQSNRMLRNMTGSDWSMEAKVKRNHSLEMGGSHWEQGDLKIEKSIGDSSKVADKFKNGDNGVQGEQKRDPRAERRIRNKDRPSIEIYRPGMGKFSMQRKEREKSAGSTTGTTESSMEQESPSSSPSPTPINMSRYRPSKSVCELRSMMFKRSVSREK